MCRSNIFYVDDSGIEGKGLFTKIALKRGECAGLLARVYGVANFNDKPFGIYINHSKDYNLDLNVSIDKKNKVIYILGVANRDIPENTELSANYRHKFAPTPNFINGKEYPFDELIN
jgi:hypothetical protein